MADKERSALEKLLAASPGMEVWWDASPLIFEKWAETFLAKQPPEVREWLEPQVRRLYVKDDPAKSLFKGVTTNPVITKAGIDTLPEIWHPWIEEEIKKHPNLSAPEITWRTYREASRLGAQLYMPIFEESGYKYGYVSAQVDPRVLADTRKMVEQGLGLKALSPNIMVKVPGTQAGVHAIFLLTAMGVPTNATLVFTVPQILAVAEAVKRGKEVGEYYGTDYSQWRSVITIMMARFEEREIMAEQAREQGFELTEDLMRWSGTAIMKKGYHLLREREYPSKLLLASSRVGPGKDQIRHLAETAGANLVYTMNPKFIQDVLLIYAEKEEFEPRIDKPVPSDVMEKLLSIPYFRQGYDENGLKQEEFLEHPGTIFTRNEFSKAMNAFEEFVAEMKAK
ncbi:MAG TPA: transaldolase [Firmicutes bacterium]|nr:transaldolase [Bacillota bacterium]